MPPNLISKLVSSWKNLTVQVDVEDLGAPAGSTLGIEWPLHKVKERFVKGKGKRGGIICPRLPSDDMIQLVARANISRGSEEDVLKMHREDPYFFTRSILAQKGTLMLNRWDKFDLCLCVDHGAALITKAVEGLTEADQQRLAETHLAHLEGSYTFTNLHIGVGSQIIIPCGYLYTIYFLEDSLLKAGNIIPCETKTPAEQADSK